MKYIHLAFQDHLSHTVCAFPSSDAARQFVNGLTETEFNELPSVHPALTPVPLFDTAADALSHFRQWQANERRKK